MFAFDLKAKTPVKQSRCLAKGLIGELKLRQNERIEKQTCIWRGPIFDLNEMLFVCFVFNTLLCVVFVSFIVPCFTCVFVY